MIDPRVMKSLFPVILSADVPGARAFYERCFGFVAVFDAGWYVQLEHPTNRACQLAIMTPHHASLPEHVRTATAGVVLSFEVEDAARELARLADLGVTFEHELRDEPWGQRHFIVRGPDAVPVDVFQMIAPAPEYGTAYSQGGR